MPLRFPDEVAQEDHTTTLSNGGYYTNDDSDVGTPYSPVPDPVNGFLVAADLPDPTHQVRSFPIIE